MSRRIDYITFNDKDNYIEVCKEHFKVLHDEYGFYFCNLCNRINSIDGLLKKKKDYCNHRCNVYYMDDECYFVCYKKNVITVDVLLDYNGSQVAHKLTKELEKLNIQKEEIIEPW